MIFGANIPHYICNKPYATREVNVHWASLLQVLKWV